MDARGLVGKRGGFVLVAAALAFAVVTLFVAVVIDLGVMHVFRARLQSAADAAVLAAVQCAELWVEKELRPVLETDYFPVGSSLPDAEAIRSKRAVYREEPVWAWNEETGAWEVVGYRDVLDGWWVTYVAAWEEVVVDWGLELDGAVARAEAEEVLAYNAARWRRETPDVVFVGPWIAGDAASGGREEARYRIAGATVYVRSFLLGPLLAAFSGDPSYRWLPLVVSRAEGCARLAVPAGVR